MKKQDQDIIFPKEMTEDLAEETGWHLGDGSMNYYKGEGLYSLRGHYEDDKPHYIDRIKPLFMKLYNINISLRDMPSTRVYGFQIWSNKLIDYKHEILGLPLGPKHNFLIPSIIANDDNLARNFIRGFFDTDGCLYLEHKNGKLYPRIEITSVAKGFVNQLMDILLRLGFRVSISKTAYPGRNWRTAYKLHIRGNEMTKKWFTEIKPNNSKHVAKFKKLNLI